MKAYHEIWLSAHPSRTEAWLQDRLKDGFDIHHIDGDHKNNDPDNLVLIESQDHMRLHGMRDKSARALSPKRGPKLRTVRVGRNAYRAAFAHRSWATAAEVVGETKAAAIACAKVWAKETGAKWPIGLKGMTSNPDSACYLVAVAMIKKNKTRHNVWRDVAKHLLEPRAVVARKARAWAKLNGRPWPIAA